MAETGREEKWLAEERGSYHEGVPAITVVVDGGWSKRSHKHSYNAKSGVAIIIGKETGKLVYATSTVLHVLGMCQKRIMLVSGTGMPHHPKWNPIFF